MDIQIITAGRSDGDLVSDGLRMLTETICNEDPEQDGGFGLGGSFGYGCNFENDVFEMRRFYWGDCTCGADKTDNDPHTATCALMLPNFRHKNTGIEVRWYKWIGRDNEISGDGNWPQIFRECLASLAPPHTQD